MKKACWLLVLLFGLSASAENVTSQRLVDVGGGKAVVFEETVSPDGRYAIGWTILVRNNAKPVDWSQWKPADSEKFAWSYDDPMSDEEQNYSLVRCIVDLNAKSLVVLPADRERSDFPEKAADIVWSESEHGRLYALVQFGNGAWTRNSTWTMDFWLITIDSTGIHQANLVDTFYKAMQPVLHEKRPLYFFAYETAYLLQGGKASIKKASFTDSSATIAFKADDPELIFDSSAVEGSLTFLLSDGVVTKVSSDTARDDPVKDMPELADATRQMNEVRNEIHQKLGYGEWADVENKQTVWEDDEFLTGGDAALRKALVDHNARDARAARDRFFLESTQKRLAELQSRLK
jgi:hypothetical protein